MAKTCRRCGVERPLTEFNRNRRERDGMQRTCRKCQLEVNRDWRERNPEKARAASRRYQARHPAPRASSRDVRRVHSALARAVRAGTVLKPSACSVCSSNGRIEAHHEDYGKPLEVRWLCPRCHQRVHAGLVT